MGDKRVAVEATYPEPGNLNLQFRPPLQTWRFPRHPVEYQGRELVLEACRSAVTASCGQPASPSDVGKIQLAVEARLADFIQDGTIVLP